MRPSALALEPTSDDFDTLHRLRDPLRHWLAHAHGRQGLAEGARASAGLAVGLLGLCLFGLSPLVAVFHLLLALMSKDSRHAPWRTATRRTARGPSPPRCTRWTSSMR